MSARVRALGAAAVLAGIVSSVPAPVAAQRGAEGLIAAALGARTNAGTGRWPRRPLLDAATEAAHITSLRRARGLDGDGATVCVVDTGVDLAHRDFLDAEGRTRATFVIALDAVGRGLHPDLEARIRGAVFDARDVDAHAEGVPGDPHGHGTAVASAALGDDAGIGARTPGLHAGAAPRAALVVVALSPPAHSAVAVGFSDDAIARGVEACFAVAPIERTVAVVALGGHDGHHDGTESLDLALDALAAQGARIVVAAGNDGATRVHAAGVVRPGDRARIEIVVPAPEPPSPSRFVALAIDGNVNVIAIAPSGARTGEVRHGEHTLASHSGGEIAVDSTRGAVQYVVLAGSDRAPFAGGRYAIELTASTRAPFDAWLVGHDVGAAILAPRLDGAFAVDGATVTIPGTARGVITVGATVSRDHLDGVAGDIAIADPIGEVATFSSRGPRADGFPKPDLVAPGALLGVALSGDLDPDDPNGLFAGSRGLYERRRLPDGRTAVAGTSFAAPLVAGTLALALGDPAHTPDARTAALDAARDARLLAFSSSPTEGAAWSIASGFGALDAEAFVDAHTRAPPVTPSTTTVGHAELSLTRPATLGGTFTIAGRVSDQDGAPWSGTLSLARDGDSVDARALPVVDGVLVVTECTPRGLPNTTTSYTLHDEAGTLVATLDVPLHIDEARDRMPLVARGGGANCAIAPPSRRPGFRYLFLLPALLAARRRRRSLNCPSIGPR